MAEVTMPVFKPASPEPEETGVSEEQRTNARDFLQQNMDPERARQLEQQLWEACQATKQIRVTDPCTKCECKHYRYPTITDYGTTVRAIELYLTQLYGRPGTAGIEESGVVVKRIVVGVDE